jgi:signal transduction histidine kinase
MVVVVGFLLAMSIIFIAIELRSRFDRSFLVFGIANILLALFSLIDIEMQPQIMSEGWTKIQHIIASFFPAVLSWYLMTLVGKVHVRTLTGLTATGVLFSLSMISNVMVSVQGGKLVSTVFYKSLYFPFMVGSIVGCMAFLYFQYIKSDGDVRNDLRWHLIGFGVLCASGTADMVSVIIGSRFFSEVPSLVIFGVLFYCLITTIVFIDRLSIIIINREHTFSKLREAYKELDHLRPIARTGQMTALFAHEVKNKSFGISLILNSVRQATLPPTVAVALEKCFSVASIISRSSSELLAQSKTVEIHSVPFDLRVCVSEAATAALTGCCGAVNVDLNLSEIVIRGDRSKLLSVFDILFTNSIQANAMHLHVRAAVGNGCAVVSVEDDGKGCEQQVFDNLFKPFFTTKKDRFGTGLGLSIAQNVIQNHEGFISAYSKNIIGGEGGTGMIFCITLPMPETKLPAKGSEPEFLVIEEGLSRQLPEMYRIFSHINVRYHTFQSGKTDISAFPAGIKTFCSPRVNTIPEAADPFFINPEISIPTIRRNGLTDVTILTEAWVIENFFGQETSSFFDKSGFQYESINSSIN